MWFMLVCFFCIDRCFVQQRSPFSVRVVCISASFNVQCDGLVLSRPFRRTLNFDNTPFTRSLHWTKAVEFSAHRWTFLLLTVALALTCSTTSHLGSELDTCQALAGTNVCFPCGSSHACHFCINEKFNVQWSMMDDAPLEGLEVAGRHFCPQPLVCVVSLLRFVTSRRAAPKCEDCQLTKFVPRLVHTRSIIHNLSPAPAELIRSFTLFKLVSSVEVAKRRTPALRVAESEPCLVPRFSANPLDHAVGIRMTKNCVRVSRRCFCIPVMMLQIAA